MRKLIWLTLIAALLVSSTLIVANVQASIQVSGTINQDTTWTIANSPYLLTGIVTVNSGVTLTVEPGVTVDLSSYSLVVSGTLNATGTNDNKIVFQTSYWYSSVRVEFLLTSTNWKSSEGSGCIVDNAVFNSAEITVSNCSPKISNNYFTNNKLTAISVSGGSALILNNSFDCQSTAISISSSSSASPTISFNFIKNSATSSGISAGNNNAYISDNNITGCYMGISATGNSTISRNLISNNTIGIYAYNPLVTIQNNIIANNSAGIMGGGSIQNNTIGNNGIGVSLAITPCNINQNNFLNNKQYNVGTTTSNATDAANNWWGTTDAATIDQTIYDSKNSSNLGIVNFSPFLTQPNNRAPALESINYLPNPTPTPYPTTIPAPTNTPYPYPTNYVTPRPNITLAPIVTPAPTPIPTITPTPSQTPLPTPSPTPKVMPGSPLSLGGSSFAEAIALFDITNIAKIVLIVLGIMWAVILLVFVVRRFVKPEQGTN